MEYDTEFGEDAPLRPVRRSAQFSEYPGLSHSKPRQRREQRAESPYETLMYLRLSARSLVNDDMERWFA